MSVQSTRERILEIAEKHFIKDGIEKTQMMEIAQDCEINRRTLYRYFATKDLLAFEVEMIVMDRIQRYMGSLVSAQEQGTGAEHVRAYFARVELGRIENWLRYTAEFDRYFQNDYPDSGLTHAFIENIRPEKDPLFRFIEEGIADGSIQAGRFRKGAVSLHLAELFCAVSAADPAAQPPKGRTLRRGRF